MAGLRDSERKHIPIHDRVTGPYAEIMSQEEPWAGEATCSSNSVLTRCLRLAGAVISSVRGQGARLLILPDSSQSRRSIEMAEKS